VTATLTPRFRGRVERVTGRVLEGWALDEQDPDRPVALDVAIDGGPPQRVVASAFRPDLAQAFATRGHHAFRFELPPALADGHPHEVSVTEARSGLALERSPMAVTVPRFRGCAERVTGRVLEGWALDELNPDRPVALDVVIDGGPPQRVVASAFRADLAQAFATRGCHAFRVELPAELADGEPHRVGVTTALLGQPLDHSPQVVTVPRFRGGGERAGVTVAHPGQPLEPPPVAVPPPRFRGRIERVAGLVVEGWALDTRSPDWPVVLDVMIDGAPRQRVEASEFRPDLAQVLGTRGHNAFRIPLPSALCDGEPHRVAVRVANTDHDLDGPPVTVRFAAATVPDERRRLEADLAGLGGRGDRLRERLLKLPLNELADAAPYRRWLAGHEASWPGEPAAPGVSGSPLFSLIPDEAVSLPLPRALREARGAYVLFPGRAGFPHPRALELLARHLGDRRPVAVYADDDVLEDGARSQPRFKPDWDPDRFLAADFVGRAVALRRDRVMEALGTEAGATPEALIAAVLLGAEDTEVDHLPWVLFHRFADAVALPAPTERARHLTGPLAALAPGARLVPAPHGVLRVERPLPEPPPPVTLIVPTRDRVDLLSVCVESVLTRTDYPALRLLIVDNGSERPETSAYLAKVGRDPRVSVWRDDGPFNFSRLNNHAVARTATPLIGLVNNDIEVTEPGWLREMAAHALRPEVGAVGAKLLFPDGFIQHGGVVIGLFGAADNAQRAFGAQSPGYWHSAVVAQNASAVTAACLVCRRAVYDTVGGLDEEAFPVAFNDVDFCLKLRARGFRVIWTPHATLLHHESATRKPLGGGAVHERERREVERLRERWGTRDYADPFYSPNLGRLGLSSHVALAEGMDAR